MASGLTLVKFAAQLIIVMLDVGDKVNQELKAYGANIMERSRELGLLKAIGATNLGVILLILAEIFIAGGVGGILGYAVSLGLAQIIGRESQSARAKVPP